MKKTNRYFIFLGAILVLSIPFYMWGNRPVPIWPLSALGLHVSFLMILVPCFLAMIVAWRQAGPAGVTRMFRSVLDLKKVRRWPLLFALLCMPIVTGISFLGMKWAGQIPENTVISYQGIPVMALFFFLGAIPEEVAWSYTLTDPLSKRYGPLATGALLGFVWGLWHVIPWSWNYPPLIVTGMVLLDILMRIGMTYNYVFGGKSLFLALLFHTVINVSETILLPGFNPWLAGIVMACIDFAIIGLVLQARPLAVRHGADQ